MLCVRCTLYADEQLTKGIGFGADTLQDIVTVDEYWQWLEYVLVPQVL